MGSRDKYGLRFGYPIVVCCPCETENAMTLAQDVAAHLPLLRRYARALTGSQKSGDNYVAMLLETIITDPGELDGAGSSRIALYRTLSRLWTSVRST